MPFPTDQVLFLLALVDLRQARLPLRRRHSESQHFKSLSECKLYGFWSLFCVIRARTSKALGADPLGGKLSQRSSTCLKLKEREPGVALDNDFLVSENSGMA